MKVSTLGAIVGILAGSGDCNTPAVARADRGIVGKGTPGRRIRRHARMVGALPLRKSVRTIIALANPKRLSPIEADCFAWGETKRLFPRAETA